LPTAWDLFQTAHRAVACILFCASKFIQAADREAI
jgi:hypothetical protein